MIHRPRRILRRAGAALLLAVAWSWVVMSRAAAAVKPERKPCATQEDVAKYLAEVAAGKVPACRMPSNGAPPLLSWIDLLDSHNIPLWNYKLSIDTGGADSPGKFFWGTITEIAWAGYQMGTAVAIWFNDWVQSMKWLAPIERPFIRIGEVLSELVNQMGPVPVFLGVTAAIGALMVFIGKRVGGWWEIAIVVVIASMSSVIFSNPVSMVVGQDGLIAKSQHVGLQVSTSLANPNDFDENADAATLRKKQTGQLVTTFIRKPHQMINYGGVLDGSKCESTYDDVMYTSTDLDLYGIMNDSVNNVAGSDNSALREKVGKCSKGLQKWADNPDTNMATSSLAINPAAAIILFFLMVLGGSVLVAGISALVEALKLIVLFVLGLLPGGGRRSLMQSLSDVGMSLVVVAYSAIFLGVYMQVVAAMFNTGGGTQTPKTFVIVDILLVVGGFIFLRHRRQLKAAAERLAQALSSRPGQKAPPARMPDGLGIGSAAASAGGAVMSAARTAAAIRMSRRKDPEPAPGDTYNSYSNYNPQTLAVFGAGNRAQGPVDGGHMKQVPGPDNPPDDPPASRPASAHGGSPNGGQGMPSRRAPRQLPSKKRKVAGGLARAGAHAAASYATGGASTAVSAARKAAALKRKVDGARKIRGAATARRLDGHDRAAAAGGQKVITGEIISSRLADGGPERKSGPAAGRPGPRPTAPPSRSTDQRHRPRTPAAERLSRALGRESSTEGQE